MLRATAGSVAKSSVHSRPTATTAAINATAATTLPALMRPDSASVFPGKA